MKQIDPTKLITKAEYARQQNVDPSRISQKVKAGELYVLEIAGATLLYDPPAEYERNAPGRPKLLNKEK